MLYIFFSILCTCVFSQNNKCEIINDGIYCIDSEIIGCKSNKLVNSTACPTERSHGCLNFYNCDCANNWQGILCESCPIGKVCENIKEPPRFKVWEIILISIGSTIGIVFLCWIFVFLITLNNRKPYTL